MKSHSGTKYGGHSFFKSHNAGKIASVDNHFYGHLHPEKTTVINQTTGTRPIPHSHTHTDSQGVYC